MKNEEIENIKNKIINQAANKIRYAIGFRETCDCCGNDARIHNYGNEINQPVIVLQNTQFLCETCRK